MFAGGLKQWWPVSVEVDHNTVTITKSRRSIVQDIKYSQIIATIGCQACSGWPVTKWWGLQFPCYFL